MEATTLQEIADLVCAWIDTRAAEVIPGDVIRDGTMYSPASRALPGMEGVWEIGDPEAWEYVDGKVDDHITDRGHYWADGQLRKSYGVDATAESCEEASGL